MSAIRMRWRKPSSNSHVRFLARKRPEPAALSTSSHGRVYALSAGQPFLSTLAEALVGGNLPVRSGPRPDPLQLADTTLYLPTRRAAHALQHAFLETARGRVLLLP